MGNILYYLMISPWRKFFFLPDVKGNKGSSRSLLSSLLYFILQFADREVLVSVSNMLRKHCKEIHIFSSRPHCSSLSSAQLCSAQVTVSHLLSVSNVKGCAEYFNLRFPAFIPHQAQDSYTIYHLKMLNVHSAALAQAKAG